MRWLDGISDSVDINLSQLWDTVKDEGAWYVAVHGVTKTWTQLRDWTTTTNQNDPFQIKPHSLAQNYSNFLFHSQLNKVLSGLWTHMSYTLALHCWSIHHLSIPISTLPFQGILLSLRCKCLQLDRFHPLPSSWLIPLPLRFHLIISS